MELDIVYNEDCLQGLKRLPDNSVDCCVTSPPYYALRDYGVEGQIGLEETPQQYIDRLTEVFMEVYRVLNPEGTLWLNIGDSYNGYKGNATSEHFDSKFVGEYVGHPARKKGFGLECKNIKPKDLIGIPWMLAFSLRSAGWYLRQDIIWHKPNPMPESVKDRCTKSHEYIFLLSKSSHYYFNHEEMQEQAVHTAVERRNAPRYGGNKYTATPDKFYRTKSGNAYAYTGKRNKRDVWSVNTKPDKVAHFATYPEELITPCILAGCPRGGGSTRSIHGQRHNSSCGTTLWQTLRRL